MIAPDTSPPPSEGASASDGGAEAVPPPPWRHAFGVPAVRAVSRHRPEDFLVEEVLGFEPDGQGEHLLVYLEKTGANTVWAARQLAALAGIAAREVSYAGLKDRHAVTRQWLSLHLGNRPDPDFTALSAPGLRVLASARHRRKLRRGSHRANRFEITLRELTGPLAERARQVAARGVPNYFGEQRYGRELANLVEAVRMFTSRRRLPREKRSLLTSAARSAVFDTVLAERVRRGDWDRLLAGDAALLDGSASWFPVEALDATLAERVATFDVHPSGPLWGDGPLPVSGEVARLEQAAADRYPVFRDGLAASGSRQARRALRLRPEAFDWTQSGAVARLTFTLPAGSYATAVLRELAVVTDVMR